MFYKVQNSSERLSTWRNFRNTFPSNGTVLDVVNAFSNVKLERRTIDYYTPDSWPGPFEIVSEGYFCQSGLTLVIASTLLNLGLIKTNKCQFDVVSNHITGTDGLVFVFGDSVYNFFQNNIVTVEFCKNNSTLFSSHIITADKLGY